MRLSRWDRILMFLEDIARYIYRMSWKLRHLKLYKYRYRHIPTDTPYCYEYTGKSNAGNPIGKTKPCAFHNFLWHMDLCMLDGGDCMMDSCKTCGVSEGWEDAVPNDISMQAIHEADAGIGTTTVHGIDELMKAMEVEDE